MDNTDQFMTFTSKAATVDQLPSKEDPTASSRKRDHIELAFNSQVGSGQLDQRFYYEPLLAGHPEAGSLPALSFLGKTMRVPIWVSSMTGGTDWAHTINHNLARACREFGMGMGLGSCRSLLYSNENLKDFDVRDHIGEEQLLFANLGIAQVEQLLKDEALGRIDDLIHKLRADGLIIHVNPLQEWLQPEGDRFAKAPLEVIEAVLSAVDKPVIVKEVGQGMGRESLRALMQLPLAAVDFAANGGTNFARLEMLRGDKGKAAVYEQLAFVGHSAEDMTGITNALLEEMGDAARCKQFIISGGVKTFLDGYYLTNRLNAAAVYGQASSFLRHARGSYEELQEYVAAQVEGLELANAFLRLRG
jgi:isopentenyl-diphosphate Delta-isomerase